MNQIIVCCSPTRRSPLTSGRSCRSSGLLWRGATGWGRWWSRTAPASPSSGMPSVLSAGSSCSWSRTCGPRTGWRRAASPRRESQSTPIRSAGPPVSQRDKPPLWVKTRGKKSLLYRLSSSNKISCFPSLIKFGRKPLEWGDFSIMNLCSLVRKLHEQKHVDILSGEDFRINYFQKNNHFPFTSTFLQIFTQNMLKKNVYIKKPYPHKM